MIETGAPVLFPSLIDLQDAHDALLQDRDSFADAESAPPDFWAQVSDFVARAQASGALFDLTRDRRAAQSILDYWANALYRGGQPAPAARLADFDPLLAPELPDEPCPYQGLAAFGRAQHAFFFGRERLVREMVERLARGDRLLAVVGASGSGKSSVVLAGLLPALQNDAGAGGATWQVRTLTPGSQPLANLAAAVGPQADAAATLPLAQAAKLLFAADGFRRDPDYLVDLLAQQDSPPTLLVVDQFEEVFTLASDEAARQAFVRQLLALTDAPGARHAVILTMRTDFVDNVARLPALWERWRTARVEVEALDINELRAAIEGPAAQVGLRFEEGIVDDLISTILGERAGLPLLQFTLLKLWQQRRRNRIPREVYAAVGNPRQALERSAEAFFTGLVYEDQQVVRGQLLRMVRPGVGSTEFTSSRLRLTDAFQGAAASDRVARVLHRLIFAERLLKLSGGDPAAIDAILAGERDLAAQLAAHPDAQVEVAHEALVRNWPRLAGWLDEERETLRQRFRLREAAATWRQQNRNPDLLWRGALLATSAAYPDLNEDERAFVEAGSETEEAAVRAERAAEDQASALHYAQQLAAAEQRNNRRLRLLVGLIGALLIGAIALAVYAFNASQAATAAALRAETERVRADQEAAAAEREKTNALLQTQRARAGEMAARANLLIAQDNHAGDVALILARDAVLTTLAITVTVPPLIDSALRSAVENATWRMTLPGAQRRHQGAVYHAQFSPDGQTVVSAGEDGTVRIWRASDLEPVKILTGHTGTVRSAAYSPDGAQIVSASEDGTVRIWDAASSAPVRTLAGHTGSVWSAAYSPDGRQIVSAGDDGKVRIWDAEIGAPLRTLEGHTGSVWSAAYSPDGRQIVSAGYDGTVRIWVASIDDLLVQAEARIQRPAHLLMDDERRQLGLAE